MTALRERARSFTEAGVLGPIEIQSVSRLARIAGVDDVDVQLGLAFAVRAPRVGHVGVDLARLAGVETGQDLDFPTDRADWMARTVASDLVGADRPFVHVGGLIVTRRYDDYQRMVARACIERSRTLPLADPAVLKKQLDQLFPPRGGTRDLQRLAALVTMLRPLTVVSGGPGTGKTFTVKKILALLFQRSLAARGVEPRVLLAAPTGKAAARMREAIEEGLSEVKPARLRTFLRGIEPTTIHRMLGFDPRRPSRFHRDRKNPLDCDAVIVDEASMIDVAMMAKLMDAVPATARLVLLGDKNQLASVEAGSVLADLVSAAGGRGMRVPPDLSARIREVEDMFAVVGLEDPACPPHAGGLVQLSQVHRFEETSGIGRLSDAIARGAIDEAVGLLLDATVDDVALEPFDPRAFDRAALEGYAPFIDAPDPSRALAAFERFRVLVAHRRGPRGVGGLGDRIEALVRRKSASRPVLVTENDADARRWNGDIGVVVDDLAWFSGGEGLESLARARLPPHEAPWAMTVHKAQGSQVDEVLLVLPERPSPIVTRELVYTAITRARRRVRVLGDEAVLRDALARTVERASALPLLLADPNGRALT